MATVAEHLFRGRGLLERGGLNREGGLFREGGGGLFQISTKSLILFYL